MRRLLAVMNMTLDGYCDHTAGIADEETHQHYAGLVKDAAILIYGRITYQLMESYWPDVVKNPTGVKSTDEFAVAIDKVPKIVYSRTLNSVSWKNTMLKNEIVRDEILALKQSGSEGDILVGSPSLIVAFGKLDLVDEYQINVLPVILGKGLPLFKEINDKIMLRLVKTKTFGCGSVNCYYEPAKMG
jgi:dihydrofolate reductase